MSRPSLLRDIIGKITFPTDPPTTIATVRVFVFAVDGVPSFVMVYSNEGGKAVVHASSTITDFTPTRFPRRDPHLITTTSGEVWKAQLAGCGCGSPIKRMTYNTAIKDWAAMQEEAQA